ncbi:MAG: hypothetical protein SNG02_06415 [Rikenellaceae bacterium]
MNYYKQDDNATKKWGALAALLYFLVIVCALLFVSFDFDVDSQDDEGILINFGVSDTGSGVRDLAATDVVAPQPPTPKVVDTTPEESLTDPQGEVEISKPEPKEEPKPLEEEVQEQPRTVNQRALFPGRTEGSTSTSQGDSATPESGNQGDESGEPEGASGGTGQGMTGVAYNLSGRSLVGELPKPDYNENSAGKVIIDVVVDEKGRVTNATYRAQGSTTNNSTLIEAARSAALKARFSESESFVQGGTITYIFKMN